MKKHKTIDINSDNKEGYYKIFNILKEKCDDIFSKIGIVMVGSLVVLFVIPANIVIFLLLALQIPFFALIYLVFMKKGFITKICKRDIEELKKQFPDLEFDTNICLSELEENLHAYNEKINETLSNSYDEDIYDEKETGEIKKESNYPEIPNHEDIKIKVFGTKRK